MSRLLLDVLREDLGKALDDPAMEKLSQDYLHELLTNDELLSTDAFTGEAKAESTKNIVEEIAELDLVERNLNLELASITHKNKDIIIDVSRDLHTIDKITMKELSNEVSGMADALTSNQESASTSTLSLSTISSSGKLSVFVSEKLYKSIEGNNNILSNIDSVLDILELPSLCKLCILQGNYQESLEISMLAQSLLIRFPGFSIFKQINQQVETELKLMVKGLVKLLNTNLRQNNILKIFQILNKLDLVDSVGQKERYLKMIYLGARFRYIVSELDALRPLIKFNKLTYLKRYIEIYREHIFNTLSIYFTIFPSNDSGDQDLLFISQFIRHLTELLTSTLKKHYNEISPSQAEDIDIDNSSLKDGLLLQIIYLCKSLTKYNVDFETIIISELCYNEKLISIADWKRNLKKVKKFRS